MPSLTLEIPGKAKIQIDAFESEIHLLVHPKMMLKCFCAALRQSLKTCEEFSSWPMQLKACCVELSNKTDQ